MNRWKTFMIYHWCQSQDVSWPKAGTSTEGGSSRDAPALVPHLSTNPWWYNVNIKIIIISSEIRVNYFLLNLSYSDSPTRCAKWVAMFTHDLVYWRPHQFLGRPEITNSKLRWCCIDEKSVKFLPHLEKKKENDNNDDGETRMDDQSKEW